MRQPVDSLGKDNGDGLIDSCPRPVTHFSLYGRIPMCTWHAKFYDEYIGDVVRK